MLSYIIWAITIICLTALWWIIVNRKIRILNESIKNALNQINAQLTGSVDALSSFFISLGEEIEPADLEQKIAITEIIHKEEVVKALEDKIDKVKPTIKKSKEYKEAKDAVEIFDTMVNTSTLIYNDCVERYNREGKKLHTRPIAYLTGYGKQELIKINGDK